MKSCRVCKDAFEPVRPLQLVCGFKCAARVPTMARKAARADRVATKERIDELRPLGYWVKQAQHAFNAWVRARDAERPCVSCGATSANQWDAGHYLTVGARPELRFDEQNVHRQCSKCNDHLSGNLIRYRVELIRRIGQAQVDRLEGPHPPQQLRAAELKAITADYRARAKALQKASR